MISRTLACCTFFLAGPVFSSAANAPPSLAAPITDEADKMVCRTEQTTGWRLPGKRVCLSKEEWDRIGGLAQDQIKSEIARSLACTGGAPQ